MFNKSIWFCGVFAICSPPNEIHLMCFGVGHFVILIHATLLTDTKVAPIQCNSIKSHEILRVSYEYTSAFCRPIKAMAMPKNKTWTWTSIKMFRSTCPRIRIWLCTFGGCSITFLTICSLFCWHRALQVQLSRTNFTCLKYQIDASANTNRSEKKWRNESHRWSTIKKSYRFTQRAERSALTAQHDQATPKPFN